MNLYTDRQDAINNEIVNVLGEHAEDHDVDAIADEVLATTGEGTEYRYYVNSEVDFWEVVQKHAH